MQDSAMQSLHMLLPLATLGTSGEGPTWDSTWLLWVRMQRAIWGIHASWLVRHLLAGLGF